MAMSFFRLVILVASSQSFLIFVVWFKWESFQLWRRQAAHLVENVFGLKMGSKPMEPINQFSATSEGEVSRVAALENPPVPPIQGGLPIEEKHDTDEDEIELGTAVITPTEVVVDIKEQQEPTLDTDMTHTSNTHKEGEIAPQVVDPEDALPNEIHADITPTIPHDELSENPIDGVPFIIPDQVIPEETTTDEPQLVGGVVVANDDMVPAVDHETPHIQSHEGTTLVQESPEQAVEGVETPVEPPVEPPVEIDTLFNIPIPQQSNDDSNALVISHENFKL